MSLFVVIFWHRRNRPQLLEIARAKFQNVGRFWRFLTLSNMVFTDPKTWVPITLAPSVELSESVDFDPSLQHTHRLRFCMEMHTLAIFTVCNISRNMSATLSNKFQRNPLKFVPNFNVSVVSKSFDTAIWGVKLTYKAAINPQYWKPTPHWWLPLTSL